MNQSQIENLIKSLYDLSVPHPSNSNPASSVREAERILQYHFHKPSLLKEALTHSSFSDGTISYERLEVVGDAALSLAMTKYLYLSNSQLGPGPISRLRSANLTNEKLARVAVWHNIYPLVLHNSPLLDEKVEEFTKAVLQEPEGEINGGSTTKAPKVLADVVEAIAAAIYEDCNFNLDIMWKVVKKLLKPLIRTDSFAKQPVTTPHKHCHKKGKDDKFHTRQKGKIAISNVLVASKLAGSGSSKQKTVARPKKGKIAISNVLVASKLAGSGSSKQKAVARPKKGKIAISNVLVASKLAGSGSSKQKAVARPKKGKIAISNVLVASKLAGSGSSKQKTVARPKKGKIAISNVLVASKLAGSGSSKQKTVARPNAAKDAHEKMRGEKSNLSIKSQHKKVGNERGGQTKP
ncbi:Ribonuclease 3-like protein 2 [Carex littledalei]|uniref:Ribonuclease 3-like protein 2 n=1 Tax=Carex littledalei TaxID=544730 RepID=A0A833VI00_9POAL|nr:Ribonuclease 3-like protein 2 [Carex littledalei]